MMERFGVVLAHLRRVQDGTRWVQCTRSMGEPEIQLLKEMVDMIPPEDDFQNVKKPSKSTKLHPDDHSQGEPEDDTQEESHEALVAFHQGPPSTSLFQILVTQLLRYQRFLPPRTRSRSNGL